MLHHAERLRHEVAGQTPRDHKSAMGQFMTSAPVADFMAAMFQPTKGPFRLLDPGAGLGALTCAVLERWKAGTLGKGEISVQAHELDDRLRGHLEQTLAAYEPKGVKVRVRAGDYLDSAEPQRLIRDAKDTARRQPEVFLGTAFIGGLILGRLLRSRPPDLSAPSETEPMEPPAPQPMTPMGTYPETTPVEPMQPRPAPPPDLKTIRKSEGGRRLH